MKGRPSGQSTSLAKAREACRSLAIEAVVLIAGEGTDAVRFRNSIPYYDAQKDERITGLATYPTALQQMGNVALVRELYGDANRILLQFAYAFLSQQLATEFDEAVFEETWESFSTELIKETWIFCGVANVQNFDGDAAVFDLPDGISIRHRSFDELGRRLYWGDSELAALADDWMHGGQPASSYVIMAQEEIPKREDNVVTSNGPNIDPRIQQMLLALRLLKPGAVGVGTIFHSRASAIRLVGGLTMSPTRSPFWRSGGAYCLTSAELPELAALYEALKRFASGEVAPMPNLMLALRRFSFSYERGFGQAEDQIVDATIALEALLLRVDEELSFRLAYRGSSILAATEEERVSLYRSLRGFYSLRSKIVHGVALTARWAQLLEKREELHDVVRRLLRAFMVLVETSAEIRAPSGQRRFYEQLDESLLHETRRSKLRSKMGLE